MSTNSLMKGFSFGLTSGVITTLGLMVGLEAGTNSKLAVIGGIIIIAIADAFSDAFGVHISEEAQDKMVYKEVWKSTAYTFLAKFFFAFTFLVPVLIFDLTTAIWISIFWGLLLLSVFSFYIARKQGEKPINTILEHLAIGIVVIILTHFIGNFVKSVFG